MRPALSFETTSVRVENGVKPTYSIKPMADRDESLSSMEDMRSHEAGLTGKPRTEVVENGVKPPYSR